MHALKPVLIVCSFLIIVCCSAQPPSGIHWSADGNSYYENDESGIVQYQMPSFTKTQIVTIQQLTPKDSSHALKVRNFFFQ